MVLQSHSDRRPVPSALKDWLDDLLCSLETLLHGLVCLLIQRAVRWKTRACYFWICIFLHAWKWRPVGSSAASLIFWICWLTLLTWCSGLNDSAAGSPDCHSNSFHFGIVAGGVRCGSVDCPNCADKLGADADGDWKPLWESLSVFKAPCCLVRLPWLLAARTELATDASDGTDVSTVLRSCLRHGIRVCVAVFWRRLRSILEIMEDDGRTHFGCGRRCFAAVYNIKKSLRSLCTTCWLRVLLAVWGVLWQFGPPSSTCACLRTLAS